MSMGPELRRVGAGVVGFLIGACALSLPAACGVCSSEPFQSNGSFAVVNPDDFGWDSGELTLSDDAVELVYTMDDGSTWRISWSIAPPAS